MIAYVYREDPQAPGHYLPISKNMDTSRNNGGAKKKV